MGKIVPMEPWAVNVHLLMVHSSGQPESFWIQFGQACTDRGSTHWSLLGPGQRALSPLWAGPLTADGHLLLKP